MERFHVIDDGAVIIRRKGVYRQVKLYRRSEGLYAGVGLGFIRLYQDHGTGVPDISWDDIEVPSLGVQPVQTDGLGRLLAPGMTAQIEGNRA